MNFTLALLFVAAGILLAALSTWVSGRLRIASPAVFLIGATAVSNLVPGWRPLSHSTDEAIVSVALALILFDGGSRIGLRRFRASALSATWIAVAGTVLTAAGIALVMHLVFGFDWFGAVLLGAALSPTDPAVVFSVLAGKEIAGRAGTILEAESGLNDPVGIALLASILGASGGVAAIAGQASLEFVVQMAVGALVGVAGGLGLRWLMRHVLLSSAALHMAVTVGAALVVYSAGALAHGSGFLAVFVAGILVGDVRAPFTRDVRGFSAGVANLGEIVTFTVLGLAVDWRQVVAPDVLVPGVVLAVVLTVILRPALVGLIALPVRLPRGERWFVLLAGLKGAVPILLGITLLEADAPGAQRLFDTIVVVVLVSVLAQASIVPWLARRLTVPIEQVPVTPWVAGLRFEQEPADARQFVVQPGAPADGRSIAELDLPDTAWISMVSRDGAPVPVKAGTRLRGGDLVLAFADEDSGLPRLFDRPGEPGATESDA